MCSRRPDAASDIVEAHFLVACALADAGQDMPRAIALARQARAAYRATESPADERALADVATWLTAHTHAATGQRPHARPGQ